MTLDQQQFDALLRAIQGGTTTISPSTVVATCAAVISLTAIATSYLMFRYQRHIERRRFVADLHRTWMSADFDAKRHVVWRELEKWVELQQYSPAIKHFAKAANHWPMDSIERMAHAAVFFFFADLNTLLRHRLIDEDLAFEMFGPAQYEHFREYIAAIRVVIKERQPDASKWPRWLSETEDFDRRQDAWVARRRRPENPLEGRAWPRA